MKQIPLDDITIDPQLHAREEVDEKLVNKYAKLWGHGVEFPPVLLIGEKLWPGDGVHRVLGKRKARDSHPDIESLQTIEAVVQEGTAVDVLVEQARRNQGKTSSSTDVKATVTKMLTHPELVRYSDGLLHQKTGIAITTFRRYRQELEAYPEKVLGVDGKWRPTKPLAARKVQESEPPEEETNQEEETPNPEEEVWGSSLSEPEEESTDSEPEEEDSIDSDDEESTEEEVEEEPEQLKDWDPDLFPDGPPKDEDDDEDEESAPLPPEEPLKVLVIRATGDGEGEVIEAIEGSMWDVMERHKGEGGLRFACGVGVEPGRKVNGLDPLEEKRAALPPEWVEPLYVLLIDGVGGGRVSLKKVAKALIMTAKKYAE
jgi:hypothetical protein